MLALDIDLLDGRYEAASNDKDIPEWPPHPARAFCALLAGARSDQEWEALRWLEQQQPPDVVASFSASPQRRAAFVVTNRRENRGKSQTHPGRVNQLRVRAAAQPRLSQFRFEWPDAESNVAMTAVLDRLALRVPYLGRSSSPVLASFGALKQDVADEAVARFRPCALTESECMLRVPYPGYVDALRDAYEYEQPAWNVARLRGYRFEREEPAPILAVASPFAEMAILRFKDWRPDGRLAPRLTSALRTALLARTADPLPQALHGHDFDEGTHVAFLALPDVGHEHARGELLGLGVALPYLTRAERRAILRAVLAPEEDGVWQLDVPGLGTTDLESGTSDRTARGATAQRWTQPATTWVSVTPMALDRHPKRGDNISSLVAQSCRLAGYPTPIGVEVSRSPLTRGGISLLKLDVPDRLRSRPMRHIRLTFDQEVQGPVVLGAGRYLGVGLFAPEPGR